MEIRAFEAAGLLPRFKDKHTRMRVKLAKARVERRILNGYLEEEVRRKAHRLFTTGRKLFTWAKR
jgi:hypothetical protein